MAISWGSWTKTSSGNAGRLGTEVTRSPSSVGTGTTSVTVTLKVYFQSTRSVSDSTNSWKLTGDITGSGSKAISHGSSGGTTLLTTQTKSVAPSRTGTKTVKGKATFSGLAPFGSTTFGKSWSTTVGRRPYSKPNTPSNVKGTRKSDSRVDVTWTRPSGWDGQTNRVEAQDVQVENFSGAQSGANTVSRSATGWRHSTQANRTARYRVRGRNRDATGSWSSWSSWVNTTPAAPGKPTAKVKAGSNVLTWKLNRPSSAVYVKVQIQRSYAPAGTSSWSGWGTIATTARNATSYTDAAPKAASRNRYRIRAITDGGSPQLTSSWSPISNIIELAAPPKKPTNLAPNGAVLDPTGGVTITWQHNATDATDQSAFQVQYRFAGEAEWTLMTEVASSVSSSTLPESAFSLGEDTEWQVRTKGEHPNFSPWSSVATILASAAPSVEITTPVEGAVVGGANLELEWTYTDPQETAQAAWQAVLTDSLGNVTTEEGQGADTTATIKSVLADGEAYSVGVRGRNLDGLWSDWSEVGFSVVYDPPAIPTLEASVVAEIGAVEVVPEAGPDGLVETEYLTVERMIGEDGTWVTIADDVEPGSAVTDYIPDLRRTNYYRTRAVSAMPSEAMSETVAVTLSAAPGVRGWVFFNSGEDFATCRRVIANADASENASREKAVQAFAGRTTPVLFVGEQTTWTGSLAIRLAPDPWGAATRDDLVALALAETVICYRDPTEPAGQRRFVTIDSAEASQRAIVQEGSVAMTETDSTETPAPPAPPLPPDVRTNLVPNPNFAVSSATGWNNLFGATRLLDTEDYHSAPAACWLTRGSTGQRAQGVYSTSLGLATAEEVWRWSYWAKAAEGVAYYSTLRGVPGFEQRRETGTGEWVYHEYVATIEQDSSAGVSMEIAMPTASTEVGDELRIDDVLVEKVEDIDNTPTGPESYFDGDTPDADGWVYAWTGAANNSRSTATGPPDEVSGA